MATDKALPPASPMLGTHTRYRHRQSRPLLLLCCQRQKITGAAHTPHSPGSQAHTHSWIPRAPARPLHLPGTPDWIPAPLTHPMSPRLTGWSSWVLAVHMQHLSYRHTTLVGCPKYQHGPFACLIPLPGPGAPYSPAGPAWSLPANPHTHPKHARLGKVQTLVPSSRHLAHRL